MVTIKAVHFAEDGANNTTVKNTAKVRSTEVEMPGAKEKTSNEVAVEVSPKADLQVTKVPNPALAPIGAPVTYTLHVYNAGPSNAANVKLEDVLPNNALWIDGSLTSSGSPTCVEKGTSNAMADDAQGKTLACEWTAQLGPNAQRSITYQLRSVPNAQVDDELKNTVTVSTTTPEDTSNNTATATVKLQPAELDVLIEMEHVNDGRGLDEDDDDRVTEYTITVKNDGPSYATNVVMTDVFPGVLDIGGETYVSTAIFSYQGMTGLSSTRSGGPAFANVGNFCVQPALNAQADPQLNDPLELVCTFPKMAPGEVITIKFEMRAAGLVGDRSSGTIFHNATVEADEEEYLSSGDPTAANNNTEDRTSVRRDSTSPLKPEVADLALAKADDTDPANDPLEPGAAVAYTLRVTNHGPEASTNAVVTDVLPQGLDYVSGGTYDASTRTVTFAVGALAKGASTEFTIHATIADPYNGTAPLVNTACVKGEGDPNPDNDCGDVKTPVKPPLKPTPVPVDNPLALLALILGMGWIARRFHMRKHA